VRVLIADDNPVLLNVLQVMLVSWGYDVSVAHDGDEAWRLLQADECPSVAILDWMMPGLSGIEVCQRVRASSFGCLTYILILTAKTGSQDLLAAMDAGADDFVTKPFKSPELRMRLRNAIQIVGLRTQPGSLFASPETATLST
jgi:DNA-binding response OmpR family regulator